MQWKLDSTLRLNEAIGNRFKTQSLFQHTPHVLHAPSKGYKAKLPAPSTGAVVPNVVPNGGGFWVGGKGGGRRRLKTHSEAFGSFDLSDGGSLRQCQCSKPSCIPRLHCSSEVRNQTNTASECPEMREAHLPCEGTSPIPPVPTTWSI